MLFSLLNKFKLLSFVSGAQSRTFVSSITGNGETTTESGKIDTLFWNFSWDYYTGNPNAAQKCAAFFLPLQEVFYA